VIFKTQEDNVLGGYIRPYNSHLANKNVITDSSAKIFSLTNLSLRNLISGKPAGFLTDKYLLN
jgi:hypothetical protein